VICFLFILAEFSLFIQYAASKAQSYLQFLSIDVFGVFSRLPGAFRLKGIIEEFFTTACATKSKLIEDSKLFLSLTGKRTFFYINISVCESGKMTGN